VKPSYVKLDIVTERPEAAKCENCEYLGKCEPAACRGDDDGPEYEWHKVGKTRYLYIRRYIPDKKRQQEARQVYLNDLIRRSDEASATRLLT